MATKEPLAPVPHPARALHQALVRQRWVPGGFGLRAGWGLAALLAVPTGLWSGCETDDPCALRQAACLDIVLIGNRDDGKGNPIAYRDLSVQACAPNPDPVSRDPLAKCDPMAPCGTVLGATATPLTLTAVAAYSANVQGLVTFKLPDSFNARPDNPPGPQVDAISDPVAKIAMLKQLRGMDPRTVRILVTQAGQTAPVWDSRCDEDLFSRDQWTMLKYYRVGNNEYRAIYAPLATAQTTPP
jgi:hypothetical protein